MRMLRVLTVALILLSASLVSGQDIPDFTRGDEIPDGHNHDWNLGPTGARGWIYSNKLETTQARQILITQVDSGSPADGLLKKGDVILGSYGTTFSEDPRKEFGTAIAFAENDEKGRLILTRWREGKKSDVTLKLKTIGEYSKTAPFKCAKSKAIFEQGCEALATTMKATPDKGNKIVRVFNTLALLSSGNEKYMPIIQRQVAWAAEYSDPGGRELCCWYYGPINMLLAEYMLATGDDTYFEDMKRITMDIVNGQSAVGSWGHRFSRPDGRLNGYGMMNAPGLPMTISLILARKAGVEDRKLDEAIERSTRLMRFYVGKGSVPYGDHHPWLKTHDDNGKNGAAALMFNLLKDKKAATYFSRMSCASHGNDRELGHTGNFTNMLWAMPGVALSGPDASGQWMKEFGWYYDLARRWDGTFRHQGPAQPRNDRYNNWDSTGAYLLAYAQPLRKLHITGATTGVVRQLYGDDAWRVVHDGDGFSNRDPKSIYANRPDKYLLVKLRSWSPVVRQRAAEALALRKGEFSRDLIKLMNDEDVNGQLGACQAAAVLKKRGSKTVPHLRNLLSSDDLWVRIKAADALAAIGDAARVAIPDLLQMLTEINPESDPRGMQQRYLCFALFDRREGLLKRSLKGVDRETLYEAVRAGLQNEDGRARGTLATVYDNLSYEEIEPILPAIHAAVVERSASGMMFADGICMSGLELMAKMHIKEAMPLCVELLELDRWGQDNRIKGCLTAIQHYGSAAKELAPQLEQIKDHFAKKRKLSDKHKRQLKLLEETVRLITSDSEAPELRSLTTKLTNKSRE